LIFGTQLVLNFLAKKENSLNNSAFFSSVIYVWGGHGDDLPRVPENLAAPLMLLD
jgi:hypothetical protein